MSLTPYKFSPSSDIETKEVLLMKEFVYTVRWNMISVTESSVL